MEEKNNFIFARIENPNEVRKNLLELQKEFVESLERYEKFKEIRKERIENIGKFRRDIKKISELMSELKEKLPKTGLKIGVKRGLAKEKFKKKPKVKVVQKPIKVEKKEMTELERLESELGDIEAKLNSLA